MLSLRVLVFVTCALGALANPVSSPLVLHERRSTVTSWTKHRRLDAEHTVPLRIGLKQSNLHRLEETLYSVSDPSSPNYGQHWGPAKIAKFFEPAKESVDSVLAWLHAEGFEPERVKVSVSKGWVHVPDATAAEVESLLGTEFNMYQHKDGYEHMGCDHYSIPAHIKEHVDLVAPTVNLVRKRLIPEAPIPSKFKKRENINVSAKLLQNSGPKTNGVQPNAASGPDGLKTCDQFITVECLRALYDISVVPPMSKQNSFAIVEFTPQSYVSADLDMFFRNFSPSAVGKRPVLVSIDGGTVTADTATDFNTNGESDLDFEYAMALTNPQPIQLYQTGDAVEGALFNAFLDAIDGSYCSFEGGDDPNFDPPYPDPQPGGFKGPQSCGIVKPANVISISYGGNEVELTAAYQERECAEHAKLGLAGVTMVFSSGDNGVAGGGDVCITADHQAESANGTVFNPGWPVTCPFVTAVGATQVDPGKTVHDPEGACEQVIFSGGGFSNIFPIPSYQKTQVASFFKNHLPPYTAAQYNNSQTTRGYPDLSANGANYVIAIDGNFSLVFGTSASAPVVASMITLINDARLEIGKKPVGFINPALYSGLFSALGVFHDITHGGNQGCGTPGFTAVSGWDPVTGLGTPDFEKMLAAFLILP